ncbi:MAG: hypothetical protein FIA91_12670 [Geobacter sp.]|nr:hypothetical protein [Geobacter sp.]
MDRATVCQQNSKQLDSTGLLCTEIMQALKEHLEATTNVQYKADIEKDIVTISNLQLITVAVKKDIACDRVGASTELLLRIAANDFKNKLALIPEKKTLRDKIIKSLKEVHGSILQLSPALNGD